MPRFLPGRVTAVLIDEIIRDVGPGRAFKTVEDFIKHLESVQGGAVGYLHGVPLSVIVGWLRELQVKFQGNFNEAIFPSNPRN